MQALSQTPAYGLDHETRKQIAETTQTLLDHLRGDADDFKALVLADAISAIDPTHDRELSRHAERFRATRNAGWRDRARSMGLDRVLFSIAAGLRSLRIGEAAAVALDARAVEISEARPSGALAGSIDKSYVPDGVHATFHPSGHLHRASVHIDELHHGELVLDALPGSGRFSIVEKRGGYGTMISDAYRDGCVITTLNTPWHDGTESSEPMAWTKWVMQNLGDLARLAARGNGASTSGERGERGKRKKSKRRA